MIARRPTRLTASTYTGAALSLLVAAAVLASSVPARAADDEVPLDTKIMRGIMETLGLRRDGEAMINYQERAPLVIPPSRTLPPPERSDAVIANNPAWPKDPDVIRRKAEAARARDRDSTAEILRESKRLRPDELTPGPKPRTASRSASPDSSQPTGWGYSEKMSPSQLGYKGGFFSNMFGGRQEDVAKFTGEPPRVSLTEPPPGYQTPSPDQPYGLSERTTAPKAADYKTEIGKVR